MLTPTLKLAVRNSIANFCRRAEANRLHWYYSQVRPFKGYGVPPESQHVGDCSGYCSLAFYWALHHVQGAAAQLMDPLAEHYSGWGNTNSAYHFLKAHPAGGLFQVGDMAIFGPASNTVHMIVCRKKGDEASAIFSSHGRASYVFSQDSPEPVTLEAAAAAQSLLGVYRHPALL
jgi:hypothetical protein